MILAVLAIVMTGVITGVATQKDAKKVRCHKEYVKQIESWVSVCKEIELK